MSLDDVLEFFDLAQTSKSGSGSPGSCVCAATEVKTSPSEASTISHTCWTRPPSAFASPVTMRIPARWSPASAPVASATLLRSRSRRVFEFCAASVDAA
jgi:hypothetical protein